MTYIYSRAKHRRSSSTMQKLPLRGALTRAQRAREVLPGYPSTTPFTTREQVQDYLNGEELTCLLCGKPYKNLGIHLNRIHKVYADDYRRRYNIPQYCGLVSAPTHSLILQNNEQHREHMAKMGKAYFGRPPHPYRFPRSTLSKIESRRRK